MAPLDSAHKAKKKLTKLLPEWREAKTVYADFQHGVDAACDRARKLDRTGRKHGMNPSTNVWQLVHELIGSVDQ